MVLRLAHYRLFSNFEIIRPFKKIFFGEAQQLEFFERLSKRLFGEAQQLQKTGLRGLEAYDSSFHDEAWVHQGQE